MRNTIAIALITIAALFFPAASFADEDSTCETKAFLAKSAMLLRQFGDKDLGHYLKGFENEPDAKEYLLSAWEYPLMLTHQTKNIAVDEFTSSAVLACHRG